MYKPLHNAGVAKSGEFVCLGKEWYRFPSSFVLPHGVRPKFIKSEFSGLLPGEFSEANVGFGLFPGTWLVPRGMNDENIEDPGKYVRSDAHAMHDPELTPARSISSTATFSWIHIFLDRHQHRLSPTTSPTQINGSH